MIIANLIKLYDAVDKLPAGVITMESRAAPGTISLEGVALRLISDENHLEPPSIASWLGATYEEVMSLFELHPVAQPQCTRTELKTISLAKQREFDKLPDDLRKRILLQLLEHAVMFNRVDWHSAKAEYGVEAAA